MSSQKHSTEEIQANQEVSVSCRVARRGELAYTSRTSSMGGPEHFSKSGSKTPQLDNEQREAGERGRVESYNSSPCHDGGEGVAGQNGNTTLTVAVAIVAATASNTVTRGGHDDQDATDVRRRLNCADPVVIISNGASSGEL